MSTGGYNVQGPSSGANAGAPVTINASSGLNIPGWVWIAIAIIIPGGGIVYLIWRMARKKKKARR